MTKKILVTGATGFIGNALYWRVFKEGGQVVRALRRANHYESVLIGEVGPDTDWSMALTGVDRVVHLAARVHEMNDLSTDPLAEFRRVNVEGTLNLARQAAETGVQRLVYLSSIKVNGKQTDRVGGAERRVLSAENRKVFREEDTPDPQDAYAISKWEAEQGLMALSRETGMEVVIIRPPLVYGPGVKANFLNMVQWLRKGVYLPFGAIHNKRSLVALDNLVDFIVTCIDHPRAANEVFLVSDGEDLSTTELLRRTAAAMGKSARLVPVPQGVLELGLRAIGKGELAQRLCGSLQVDSSKAREVLGWRPVVTVDEGLRRAVAPIGSDCGLKA